MGDTTPLFLYLNHKHQEIDQREFNFQYQSHPDYPSLLALSDTLNFFNIPNGALRVMSSEIELLPDSFIAKLKKGGHSFLAFIVKKGDLYTYSKEDYKKRIEVSKEELLELWDDVVIIIEKEESPLVEKKEKNNNYFVPLFFLLLLVALLHISFSNIWTLSFYIFPIIGFLISLGAFKELFNAKSAIFNKFCNVTASSNCAVVVDSSKWKLFKVLSLSDLSIIFFSTQILALLIMGITSEYNTYFLIQTLLLMLSLPVIALSLYYQKYIEKKWCPICLSIIAILLTEIIYILFSDLISSTQITWNGTLIYLFLTFSVLMVWYPIKNFLIRINELKEVELKANRFKRRYDIFKNLLVTSDHFRLPADNLVFGKHNSPLKISIITSPFCGHCLEPHYMLKSILDKYGEQLTVSIMYNVNPKDERIMPFAKSLISLKLNNADKVYFEAMDYWYQIKDLQKWLDKYGIKHDPTTIETTLIKQHLWFSQNNFNFTPCLFINGYQYPKAYNIMDLPFFIEELLDDPSFISSDKNKNKIAVAEKLRE